MRPLLLTIAFFFLVGQGYAQQLYTRAYGEPTNSALLFLHGGPGFHSATFEVSTAEALADSGFYVIVYDRSGEGRSKAVPTTYTFSEAIADIDSVLLRYGLTLATLLGHSFGGILATEYALEHPERVDNVVLVGVPLAMQASLRTILRESEISYKSRENSVNLDYIRQVEAMDTASLLYANYLFGHAIQNNFYRPSELTAQADSLYARTFRDSFIRAAQNAMGFLAVQGFHANEQYTTLDLTEQLQQLNSLGVPLYGIYGTEDGLFDAQQLAQIEQLIGSQHFVRLAEASHAPFLDQQPAFIATLRRLLLH